ncbi:hypothetical protein [Maridesulfovibrio sp.]|uniref:hypothetical protein n=1 Tax=Maridesulfovibrio sp. TaxID=2795000 RepID=UPI002A18B5B2|nr:hypothetical protein [Maridesulfovibrio sp.]
MKRISLLAILLIILSGCAGRTTSMQDVRSFCRSISTSEECDGQEAICAEYSEVTLKSYASAKECRQGCESVRQKSALNEEQQTCLQLFQSVEGKCNEFCDDNYQ